MPEPPPGCGLDTRYERVDNSRVEWYDLDLPAVIERRAFCRVSAPAPHEAHTQCTFRL